MTTTTRSIWLDEIQQPEQPIRVARISSCLLSGIQLAKAFMLKRTEFDLILWVDYTY